MAAGLLARAGYFMGENLYPPRDSNQKGFFEAPEINGINEDLLSTVVPERPAVVGRWYRHRPRQGQRWLAAVDVAAPIHPTPQIEARIRRLVAREPYCFKDPRFSYTLGVWRSFLKNVHYLCVFRDPGTTALSILRECRTMRYLQDLKIDQAACLRVWTLMYRHILEVHRRQGDWTFVHYDQIVSGEALDELESKLNVSVDREFAEARLSRSSSTRVESEEAVRVYAQLCSLARYDTARELLP